MEGRGGLAVMGLLAGAENLSVSHEPNGNLSNFNLLFSEVAGGGGGKIGFPAHFDFRFHSGSVLVHLREIQMITQL